MNGANKLNVAQIIESWALECFYQSQGQRKAPADGVRADISWDRLKFLLSTYKWDKLTNLNSSSTQILLNGNYRNSTETSTHHTVKLNKQTEATCTANIVDGQTTGLGVKLRVPLPSELTNKTQAFGQHMDLDTNDVTHTSADMTWTVDTNVMVPAKNVTNVKVIVKEHSFEVNFNGTASLEGTVVVNIFNTNNGAFISSIENDVTEILQWYARKKTLRGVTIQGRQARWQVKGVCHFQFGVEHEVKISPTASSANDQVDGSSSCVVS